MDKTQLFSLFIILIMFASMASVAVLYATQQPEEEPVQPAEAPEQEQEQPPLQEMAGFQSDPIDANVVEVFPSLFLTAQTSETEINLIDAEIYGLQGITKVNSQYETGGLTQITSGLSYMANISFQPGLSNQEILENIKQKTTKLSGIEAYSSALLKVPVTIELKNIQDENVVREYSFAEPFTQGFIAIETRKGDAIKIIEQLVFSGENLVESIAFEVENVSAQPVQLNLIEEKKIDSLTKEAGLAGEAVYSGQDFSALEEEMKALGQITNLKINSFLSGSFIEFSFDGNVPQEMLADLNASLSGLAGVTSISFSAEPLLFYLGFEEEADYPALKQAIQNVLGEKGVAAELVEPTVYLNIDLNAETADLNVLSGRLLAILAREKVQNAVFYQKAFIDLVEPKLVDPESGQTFYTDQNQTVFEAWLKAGHKTGEKVEVEIRATSLRNQITALQAMEP